MLLQKKPIHNIAKASYLDRTHLSFVQLKTLIIFYKAKPNMLPINLQFIFITIEEIH